jgi:hypothetical protein
MAKKIIKIAFYKGEGDWADKAIKIWTRSEYSHVELVVGNEWTSTSPRTLKLEQRILSYNPDHWDMFGVEVDMDRFDKLYKRYKDCKYDWTGIFLSQFLPLNIEDPDKLFCSEWCAMVIGMDKPNQYSPASLHKKLKSESKLFDA